MPETKVIKSKPVEATRKTLQRPKPVKVKAARGAESSLKVPAVRKGRASSCPRCPQSGRCESATTGAKGPASQTGCERRARSSSITPKPTENGTKTNPQCRYETAVPAQKEQRSVRAEGRYAIQSNKAFTVIPPNPKKRREIQKKAEAELAALEEFRLSRAMAYVSINPSSVGGCMSLEEVRLKQQQEMMQAKRKQKPVKKQVMEETPFLTSCSK
ncbi:uncharacterized protein [Embiotoca jacksoni]|uniref:uncharacterized protein n=1 Tax=Embiotoca jacksoni TaxID=100190 RepID=UPI0037041CD7